jgi:hypothetical protein
MPFEEAEAVLQAHGFHRTYWGQESGLIMKFQQDANGQAIFISLVGGCVTGKELGKEQRLSTRLVRLCRSWCPW